MSGIRVFNQAIGQVRQNQVNMEKLKQARQKHEEDAEMFDFKKRKTALDIEGLERDGRISDEQLDYFKTMSDMAMKKAKLDLEARDTMISNEEKNQKRAGAEAMGVAKSVVKTDPGVVKEYHNSQIDAYFGNMDKNAPEGFMFNRNFKPGSDEKMWLKKKEGDTVSRKEIVQTAISLWKKTEEGKPADYLQEAEALLTGKEETPKREINTITEEDIKKGAKKFEEPYNKRPGALEVARDYYFGNKKRTNVLPENKIQQFRNKKTGKIESFKKVNGKWEKAL
jgi:hypothetical protein